MLKQFSFNNTFAVGVRADTAIALGAGLKGEKPSFQLQKRLDKAFEYSQENKNAVIIVSGGQGDDEMITEAQAMKTYLLEKGLPENRIIMEEQPKTTYENFQYSKVILNEQLGMDAYSIVFITNDFHVLRASIIADRSGFKNIEAIDSDSYTQSLINDYLREGLAVVKTFILGK